MGTRSITTIIDNQWPESKPEKLCTMYRQYDGYPSVHGLELFDFLSQFTIVNGIGLDHTRKIANGAGCLAAQMIAHFKQEPGGIYMTKTRTALDGEDYGYEITVTSALTIDVVVRSHKGKIFGGSLHEFGIFCAKDL
jgi:hypothetical protein